MEFRTRHEHHAEVTLNATGFQRESDPVRLRIRELNLRDQQVNVVPVEIVPRRHTIIARGHGVTDASKRRGERNEKPRIIMGYECVHRINPIKDSPSLAQVARSSLELRVQSSPEISKPKAASLKIIASGASGLPPERPPIAVMLTRWGHRVKYRSCPTQSHHLNRK